MNITLNPTNNSQQKKSVLKQNNVSIPVQNRTKSLELPRFDTVGRSMVAFKGVYEDLDRKKAELDRLIQEREEELIRYSDDPFLEDQKNKNGLNLLQDRTIEELEELKKFYQSNQEVKDGEKKAAQANLDKIANWNYTREYNNQKLKAESEIIEKGLDYRGASVFSYSKRKEIREKHYYEFVRKDLEIEKLKEQKYHYEYIVNSSPLTDNEIKTMTQVIDNIIKQKKEIEEQRIRLEGLDGVQKTLDAMSNAKGGMNERIAGYEYEKDELKRIFTDPLAQSQNNPEMEVPPAVLLHGATGTGKTTFINAIGHEANVGDYAKVIDLSPDVNGDDFLKEFKRQSEIAVRRYFEKDENGNPKRTRTILLINEAERFLGMMPEQAERTYGDLIDAIDIKRMEKYGNNFETIDKFKTKLDICAEPPKDINDDSGRAALTVFVTTNYPHLIDRDVLRKTKYFAINPAKNDNLQAVVKYYFEKASNVIEKIKKTASNPNFTPKDLDHIIGTSIGRKAKQNLIRMIETGEVNQLNIDYKNIPYDKLPRDFNPGITKGAYNNRQFMLLTDSAFNKYLEDPSHSYYSYFYKSLFNEPREIDPGRYKKFVAVYNALAPLNMQENESDDIIDKREKELLLKMERDEALDEKDEKRLEYIRMREATELQKLEIKEQENTLTSEEKQRLEELKNPQILDNSEEDEE